MNLRVPLTLLLIFLLRLQGDVAIIDIPIQNPSFEDHATLYPWFCGASTIGNQFPGWVSYNARVIAPMSPRSCDFSDAPDGKQMVVIREGFISQDLGDIRAVLPHNPVTGETNGVLKLRVSTANYFYWYRGHYTASLLLTQGDAHVTLCSTSGWGHGDFTDVTLTCPEQRASGHLVIKLESSGDQTFVPNFPGVPTTLNYQMLVDNVSLTFAPSEVQ